MDDWLKRENRRLEKENERLKSLLFSTKKDKTIQVSSYYHEKLKEIEEICKLWKALRVLGMESDKIELDKLYSFIEKEADKILSIIKEK
tara:strand:- start:512 stop:778 length:267 start_codon:yes stop_codon:yes gene_type:complete